MESIDLIMKIIGTFDAKEIAIFALFAFAVLLITLTPVIWPAIRAFSRKSRLPRPWLFTFVVATLTYGSFILVNLVSFILTLPAVAYEVYIVPTLHDMGQPYSKWIVGLAWLNENMWVVLVLATLIVTVILTRKLAAKWSAICSVLAT